MFFAPPKVKSLSRYAEYGAYLGNRHFLLMLAIAFTAHMAIIVIYSMVPSERVVKIPVRVMNIKLTGGSTGNGIHMPAPAAMPAPQAPAPVTAPASQEPLKSLEESTAEKAMDKEFASKDPKPEAVPTPAKGKKVVVEKEAHKSDHKFSIPTPKKYVRESGSTVSVKPATGKGSAKAATTTGNGSGVSGDAGGSEVISRYTQTVSQWIKNHQDYARAAYAEAAQGQGSVTGQVVIRLRIDRDGHIHQNRVEHTSGNELVDEAAQAMVSASDPVPSVPSDYPSDSQLEFLIAVQVDLSKR